MYNVIKDIINLTHIEYYDSFKDFINRMSTNNEVLTDKTKIIPLNKSYIEFGDDNISIGSDMSNVSDSVNSCYNNCELVIPGIERYIILQDYGNCGHDIDGYKSLDFIVGSVIPSINISLAINDKGMYISYSFNKSLVMIKVSDRIIDNSNILSEIDHKNPFNTQFYLKDDHILLYIGISTDSRIELNEDTGVLFSELVSPESLNRIDAIKWNNCNRLDSEYHYIEFSDLLNNGFTSIYEYDWMGKDDDEWQPDFKYLMAENNSRVKLGLTIDCYGYLVGVDILNSSHDFYPRDIPSWINDKSEYKNRIISVDDLIRYIKEG